MPVVDGGENVDDDGVGVGWAGRRVHGHDGEHAVSAGGGVGCRRRRRRRKRRRRRRRKRRRRRRRRFTGVHSRGKQKLFLAVDVAAAHQVHVLAPLHQVVLASRV